MKRSFIGTFALAFALSGISLAAQDRTSNGNTTGTSAPRGGDSGGSSGSSGGSSGSGGSSSSGGSMGGGSVSAPSGWSSMEAPRRADEQRSRGGARSSGEAVSRGRSGSGDTAASAGSEGSGDARRAVPAYSRPRDGRPVTGTAVERTGPPPNGGGGNGIIYYPYYPWSYWGPGYAYGLGYMFYDPFYGGGYGWGDPYGYGYGGGGYGYGGGGYGGGSGGYAVSREYRESGNLRLKIDPKKAQVYVDGYYVGVVDSFDGAFQKLGLDSGDHKIELKADGFEALQFDVLITPGETVTYKGEMKRINK